MRLLWLHQGTLSAARHAHGGGASNLWTIAAVLVAAIGSAIVAWQALETHRTTNLSQRTLDASHSLAIDSARSRLDQEAPRVEVYVEQVSVLPAGPADRPGGQAGPGTRWTLPADAGRLLQVQARVRVINLMDNRTTHLTAKGMHDPAMRADPEVLLVPAAKLSYLLTARFTLAQWAENWAAHQAGAPPPHVAEGCVISGDDRDEGVVDRWPLTLAAWPVQPAADGDGAWQLAGMTGSDWFHIAMRPLRVRSYWISQRDNIPLPEPVIPPPAERGNGRRKAP